jgi:hypothetical protein
VAEDTAQEQQLVSGLLLDVQELPQADDRGKVNGSVADNDGND